MRVRTTVWPVAGGACLASAVCLWFPYVLTVPAAVVSPVFFKGADRKRARIVLQAALFAALVAGVAYGLAAADLGISTVGGFREWLLESRHGTENRGVARMVFGLGRSFVSMGDYASGKVFYYRQQRSIYHTILPQTDYVSFQEVT